MPSVKKSEQQPKKQRKQGVSRTIRAGLTLPVGRIHRMLRKGNYAARIGNDAPVCMAATLEYLVEEIFDLAGQPHIMKQKKRIIPRHISIAVKSDWELNEVFKNVTIPQGGVVPNIEQVLLPQNTSTNVKTNSKNKPEAANIVYSDSESDEY